MNYMNQPRGNCSPQGNSPTGCNRQNMEAGCNNCTSRNNNPRRGNNSMNSRCKNNCGNSASNCQSCDANSSSRNDPLEGMPIGIGYVPWQQWRTTYDYCEGLSNGTIFPCLNLPFLGCIPRDFRYNKGGRA